MPSFNAHIFTEVYTAGNTLKAKYRYVLTLKNKSASISAVSYLQYIASPLSLYDVSESTSGYEQVDADIFRP